MNEIYEKRVQEQNEDLKTKGDKGVIIELTDKEYSNLTLLALKVGFKNAGELLSSFVGDLTGWHTNGSDESDLADRWYDRAFGILEETHDYFRHFLYDYNYEYDIDELAEDEDYFDEVYSEYLENEPKKDHNSKEECLAIIKKLSKKNNM